MLRVLLVIGVVLCLTAGELAIAEESEAHDTTEYKFTDEIITGETDRPLGVGITGGRRPKEISLIRLRGHFVTQLIKSVEDI